MLLEVFKALADNTRLRITHILLTHELSVNELVQILEMGQSRISRHLKILSEAGILQFRRDGLWVFYSTPASGRMHDFLESTLRFLPITEELQSDLDKTAKKLEERHLKTRMFFNNIAEKWDALNHEILGKFDLAAKVCSVLPEKCITAVDLGCGTGEVLEKLLDKSERVIGVDGSAQMLQMCHNRLSGIDEKKLSLRIGDLSHLPLADQEADFACLNLVLHHLHCPESIFHEIRRILSPNGYLFLTDFTRHSDETMRLNYGDHWLGLDPARVENNLKANGFEIKNTILQPVNHNLSLFMIEAAKAH